MNWKTTAPQPHPSLRRHLSTTSFTPTSYHFNRLASIQLHPHYSHSPVTQTHGCDRPKLLFFGSDSFSSTILNQLIHRTDLWSQIHVVTPPISRTGRGLKQIYRPPLLDLATQLGLPVQSLIRPDPPHQHRNPLNSWSLPQEFDRLGSKVEDKGGGTADPILITASFPYFIPRSIVERFRASKAINVHPSLLPAYRGPAPIQWQIADRLQHSGVTIQDLSLLGFDQGNILAQEIVHLPIDIDYATAEARLADRAAGALCSVIERLDQVILDAQPQDPHKASHAPKITPSDLRIQSDWTLEKILARYRAMGHQYPLSIQVDSEIYYVIPEVQENGRLNEALRRIEEEEEGGRVKIGRIIYDRAQDLVGIRVRSESSSSRYRSADSSQQEGEEEEEQGAVLVIKAFKLALAGGKGWIQPSAWWDRQSNRLRRRARSHHSSHPPSTSASLKPLSSSVFLDPTE